MIDSKAFKKYIKEYPELENELRSFRRRTGKSLGATLELMGKCMKNPNVEYKIEDFEPYQNINKLRSSKWIIVPLIQDVVKKLKLKNFIINATDLKIKYDLSWLEKE